MCALTSHRSRCLAKVNKGQLYDEPQGPSPTPKSLLNTVVPLGGPGLTHILERVDNDLLWSMTSTTERVHAAPRCCHIARSVRCLPVPRVQSH